MARPVRISRAALAIATLLLFMPAHAFAAEEATPAVAHVSFVEGKLTLLRRGSPDAPAVLNSPVFAGDELVTRDGRGEVQLDDATVIRMAPGTRLTLADLRSGDRAVRLDEGAIEFHLLRDPADGRVQTPTITAVAEQSGSYRVEVLADGSTELFVRAGRASVPLPNGGVMTVLAGSALRASGSPADPDIIDAPPSSNDGFDAWNDTRDLALDASLAADKLSPDLAANALYGYGHWINDTPYGVAWAPDAQPAGWAPYTLGSWIETPLFGPTWVSNEPWGWAPYHYGRWVDDPAYGWIWVPDGADAGWAPALVALIPLLAPSLVSWPFGPSVGWYPLAPYASYIPLIVQTTTNATPIGRLYTRPGFTYTAPNMRFAQRSIVGAPAHYAPAIRMNVSAASGGGGGHSAAVAAPVHAEVIVPSRAEAAAPSRR